MSEEAVALLDKEAGLLRAMELRKELFQIAESFKEPQLEFVVMQLKCACNSLVLARNTFDELVGFANYKAKV
ncbi:hypothetical protein JZU46_06315 [bacterium]|nr:hypothetical protein [bacterium]